MKITKHKQQFPQFNSQATVKAAPEIYKLVDAEKNFALSFLFRLTDDRSSLFFFNHNHPQETAMVYVRRMKTDTPNPISARQHLMDKAMARVKMDKDLRFAIRCEFMDQFPDEFGPAISVDPFNLVNHITIPIAEYNRLVNLETDLRVLKAKYAKLISTLKMAINA